MSSYYQSHVQNADAPVLPTAALKALYGLVEWEENSTLRYQILYDVPYSNLPPTYLQADGVDPLKDNALIYHELLVEAGTKAKIDLYPGCPRAHFLFMPELEVSEKAIADIIMNLGWLLGKHVTEANAWKAMGVVS